MKQKLKVLLLFSLVITLVLPTIPVKAASTQTIFNDDGTLEYYNDGIFVVSNGVLTHYYGTDTKITVPDGVTTIGQAVFSNATNSSEIKSIDLPKTVTAIDDGAFSQCFELEIITGLENVKAVGSAAFLATKFIENETSKTPLFIINNIVIDGNKCTGNLTIPSNITAIAGHAFTWYSKDLKSITIPKSVKEISEYAFYSASFDDDVNIYVYKDSYAEKYFKEDNRKYEVKSDSTSTKSKALVAKIKATSSLSINKNKSKSINITFPNGLSSKTVTIAYKSSNTKIATVSNKGKVTAKNKKGSTKITITIKDKYGNKRTLTTKVTVIDNSDLKKQTAIQNMKDIQVLDGIYVKKGEKLFIEISYPYNRHLSHDDFILKGYGPQEIKSISYKVKDTKIATVSKKGSKDGYITGKKKGWTKVVVTFKDIYGYTYSYTANVFVNISQSDAFKMQHPEYFE